MIRNDFQDFSWFSYFWKKLGMPIYEYESIDPKESCQFCKIRFEVIQTKLEKQLSKCPNCGYKVRKLISKCSFSVVKSDETYIEVEKKISEYEKKGMWSHAAELADKQTEKSKHMKLRYRALDNYEKAGQDVNLLDKQFRKSKLEST